MTGSDNQCRLMKIFINKNTTIYTLNYTKYKFHYYLAVITLQNIIHGALYAKYSIKNYFKNI